MHFDHNNNLTGKRILWAKCLFKHQKKHCDFATFFCIAAFQTFSFYFKTNQMYCLRININSWIILLERSIEIYSISKKKKIPNRFANANANVNCQKVDKRK